VVFTILAARISPCTGNLFDESLIVNPPEPRRIQAAPAAWYRLLNSRVFAWSGSTCFCVIAAGIRGIAN
jgi:hypothetical protein